MEKGGLLKGACMLIFETRDQIYVSSEEKSSKNGRYIIHIFKDCQTNRQYKFYEWSGFLDVTPELEPGKRYFIKGYINSVGNRLFLVMQSIAEAIKNTKGGYTLINPFTKKEGTADVGPKGTNSR